MIYCENFPAWKLHYTFMNETAFSYNIFTKFWFHLTHRSFPMKIAKNNSQNSIHHFIDFEKQIHIKLTSRLLCSTVTTRETFHIEFGIIFVSISSFQWKNLPTREKGTKNTKKQSSEICFFNWFSIGLTCISIAKEAKKEIKRLAYIQRVFDLKYIFRMNKKEQEWAILLNLLIRVQKYFGFRVLFLWIFSLELC